MRRQKISNLWFSTSSRLWSSISSDLCRLWSRSPINLQWRWWRFLLLRHLWSRGGLQWWPRRYRWWGSRRSCWGFLRLRCFANRWLSSSSSYWCLGFLFGLTQGFFGFFWLDFLVDVDGGFVWDDDDDEVSQIFSCCYLCGCGEDDKLVVDTGAREKRRERFEGERKSIGDLG